MPNSAWLNRNVKACLATTGYLSGQPIMPLRIDIAWIPNSPNAASLQFAIGRVIFDPLRVAAEFVALVQHRRMAVGEPRAFVEMATGEPAEPVEMRLDVVEQRIRQMDTQQVRQRRIGAIEIHA